jgi:hypothetical protein
LSSSLYSSKEIRRHLSRYFFNELQKKKKGEENLLFSPAAGPPVNRNYRLRKDIISISVHRALIMFVVVQCGGTEQCGNGTRGKGNCRSKR